MLGGDGAAQQEGALVGHHAEVGEGGVRQSEGRVGRRQLHVLQVDLTQHHPYRQSTAATAVVHGFRQQILQSREVDVTRNTPCGHAERQLATQQRGQVVAQLQPLELHVGAVTADGHVLQLHAAPGVAVRAAVGHLEAGVLHHAQGAGEYRVPDGGHAGT